MNSFKSVLLLVQIMTAKLGYVVLASALLLNSAGNAYAGRRAYAAIGTSTNASNPINVSFGATLSKDIGKGFSAGIDASALVENTNYEADLGIKIEKDFHDYSFGLGAGVSMIQFEKPLAVSDAPIKEPIAEGVTFLKAELSRNISGKARATFGYERNFGDEKIFGNGYPRNRFSFGAGVLF